MPAHVVIGDDCGIGRNAVSRKKGGEIVRRRQRMPAVGPRLGAREFGFDRREIGARHVTVGVQLRAATEVEKVVSTVEDDPPGITQMGSKFVGAYQHATSMRVQRPG